MTQAIVYAFYDKSDGRIFYIGATSDMQSRMYQHRSAMRRDSENPAYKSYITGNNIDWDVKVIFNEPAKPGHFSVCRDARHVEHRIITRALSDGKFLTNRYLYFRDKMSPKMKKKADELYPTLAFKTTP